VSLSFNQTVPDDTSQLGVAVERKVKQTVGDCTCLENRRASALWVRSPHLPLMPCLTGAGHKLVHTPSGDI